MSKVERVRYDDFIRVKIDKNHKTVVEMSVHDDHHFLDMMREIILEWDRVKHKPRKTCKQDAGQ